MKFQAKVTKTAPIPPIFAHKTGGNPNCGPIWLTIKLATNTLMPKPIKVMIKIE